MSPLIRNYISTLNVAHLKIKIYLCYLLHKTFLFGNIFLLIINKFVRFFPHILLHLFFKISTQKGVSKMDTLQVFLRISYMIPIAIGNPIDTAGMYATAMNVPEIKRITFMINRMMIWLSVIPSNAAEIACGICVNAITKSTSLFAIPPFFILSKQYLRTGKFPRLFS